MTPRVSLDSPGTKPASGHSKRLVTSLIAAGAILVTSAVVAPLANAGEGPPRPFAPVASIAVSAPADEISLSADSSALLTFSTTTGALASYNLDDCKSSGTGVPTLDCSLRWTAQVPGTASAWHVAASKIFVLSQNAGNATLTTYATADGRAMGEPVTLSNKVAQALTYVPSNNHAYVLARDGVVVVNLALGTVESTIPPRGDGPTGELPVLQAGQRAITFNPFSTGTGSSTPQGIVYAAYGEYLTTVNVATNTRIETTRRLTSPAGITQSGVSDNAAAAPSLFASGYLSTGTYRTFGISSEKVHGKPQNAVYLYNTLVGGSTSTNGAAWVPSNPVGLAVSTTADLLFASSDSNNSVSVVDATATGNTAPKPLVEHALLDDAGLTVKGSRDVAGVAVSDRSPVTQVGDTGVSVFVANPVSHSVTVLERRLVLDASQPEVSGTAQVGQTLTAIPGTWTPEANLQYQWFADGAAIADHTEASYAVEPADLGKALSVAVSGTLAGYASTTVVSAATAAVVAGDLTGDAPQITGQVTVDHVVRAEASNWTEGSALTYIWKIAGVSVPGASGDTFTLRAVDAGKRVSVHITGSKPGYEPLSRESTASDVVALGTLATGKPTISGSFTVGRTLTANAHNWAANTALSYLWFADGKPVAGATKSKLTLSAPHQGKRITVQITGKKSGYHSTAVTSPPTLKIAAGTLKSATPKISGTPRIGKKLSVKAGKWSVGTSLTYRWLAGGRKITGATKKTLRLSSKQRNKKITVRVTGKKSGYRTAATTSTATVKVSKRATR